MARIADLIGAVVRSATTPSPEAGILAVPAARVLLTLATVLLMLSVFIAMRLQFSRYEQASGVRWSAIACFVAVIVCGTAAVVYGHASL